MGIHIVRKSSGNLWVSFVRRKRKLIIFKVCISMFYLFISEIQSKNDNILYTSFGAHYDTFMITP